MKLKYLLPTACEVTRLQFELARCIRGVVINGLLLLSAIAFLCLNSCTLRVDTNGTRTWGTDPASAAAIVNEIIDAK
jgi:hypothetical protein